MSSIFTPTLLETFHQDIRDFVFANMRATPTTLPHLQAKSPTELLAIYGNWRRRQVDPVPRFVHQSAALKASRYHYDLRWRRKFRQLAKVGSTSMKDGLYDWEAEAVLG